MHSATCLLLTAVVVAAAFAAPAPQENKPKLTVEASHTRHGGGHGPSGHTESVKVTQDAWVSKNGNWRAGGYVQHDREKFGGYSNKNTHGGFSVTGRF